jgi:hypothetical protein
VGGGRAVGVAGAALADGAGEACGAAAVDVGLAGVLHAVGAQVVGVVEQAALAAAGEECSGAEGDDRHRAHR